MVVAARNRDTLQVEDLVDMDSAFVVVIKR